MRMSLPRVRRKQPGVRAGLRRLVRRKTMSSSFLQRQLACCLALCMAFPAGEGFASPLNPPNGQETQSAASSASNSLPAQSADPEGASGAAQSGTGQQPTNPSKPVGTAVAPYEKTTGVTGSRPAGAVIAPAKQRRVRAIFIKVAVVVGAAAAVGAVVALSHASPSRPN